jgi:hypothetical protein
MMSPFRPQSVRLSPDRHYVEHRLVAHGASLEEKPRRFSVVRARRSTPKAKELGLKLQTGGTRRKPKDEEPEGR